MKCGGGFHARSRSCTNPPPAFGGAVCTGQRQQVQECNVQPCASEFSGFLFVCFFFTLILCLYTALYLCVIWYNPTSPSRDSKMFIFFPCAPHFHLVDGNWARWQSWSVCTKSCGGGTQDRTRACSNPPPAYGGRDCRGKNKEVRSCNNVPCPGKSSETLRM